ncbi:MAG TPA: hypothetical protein VKS81_08355 [Bacteroidota bacterium]|nr:hypothetical protein [Bacteroidota bacterium]
MLIAELRLMFKGISRWWYLVALGLVAGSAFSPVDVVREYLLPFCWIWPVLLWSAMGTREKRTSTEQVIFSTPHLLRRQFPAIWLAGVAVSLALGFGAGIQFLISGEWLSLFAWAVAVVFIPTLALTLGVWSGSSKLFEVVYTFFWYIGPINKTPGIDYIGTSAKSLSSGTAAAYLIASVVLLLVAFAGRKRQILGS